MKIKDKKTFFETLQTMYVDAEIELHYSTPFQLLIAVIMSAQTTDKQVNKVTEILFQTIKSPTDVLAMGETAFAQAIKSIGLYKAKAKNIVATSKILADHEYQSKQKQQVQLEQAHKIFSQHGYYIPDSIEALTQLHGVGEKTAKVVARALYHMPFVAVDTHVHRVSNRIGLVQTKNPLQTSKIIEKTIGPTYTYSAHHTLVLFGRYHCLARKPQCKTCPFTKFCVYYKQQNKTAASSSHKQTTAQ